MMDSDWDIIQKCLQFRFELRPSANEIFDFVMRRLFSSDSSSLPDGPRDDAQGAFPGASPRDDSDDSNDFYITEHLLNSPRAHHDHELTNVIVEPEAQTSSSCLSLPSLSSTGSVTVFDTACSSLPSLGIGLVTSFDANSLRSTSISRHEQRRSAPSPPVPLPNASSSHHETRPRKRNIVIFGETGSGKSSIINTIAQNQLAKTSDDAHGCTSTVQPYPVEISGQRFVLIDTAGLNLGTDTVSAAKAEEQLKSLLHELMSSRMDGISLLVYCMYSTIAPRALDKAYNKFYSGICQKKVPIVVVVTGLEKETRMESWWDTNREIFKGMYFADHACVTALRERPSFPDNITRRIAESGDILRKLLLKNCADLAVDHHSDLAVDKSRLKYIVGRMKRRMAGKK
ncbi:P-loop containing nucleoside triphosphate hydrolase protein [Suillus subalutaceus]|uniref:P-loop containing nucleoside triphosphate hydrolase protein n=1 Tax=Suillus subalutaceus TaxID=48586 RepID=UPI001B8641C0|nr:P-loop containing nucleoside triphosphate hydrolase protein [Suillus subalutaceus]KAG1835979.1 P-loop containing nucleoside triphosphate hydrolase protein [Suillus subalutaceus]